MKIIEGLFSTIVLLAGTAVFVNGYIDLGPAYNIHIPGKTNWKLVGKYPQKPVFVEGLEMIGDDTFIQSVGLYSGSLIQKLSADLKGKSISVTQEESLPNRIFGEGCTKFGDKIYQMTYREGQVYVYDYESLSVVNQFLMPSEMEEGWGLTHSDTYLYASDGTDQLFKIDPSDFSVVSIVRVTLPNGKSVNYINELEYANGFIYANVLPQNIIIQVDPDTGNVTNVWDMSSLFDVQMSVVKSNHGYYDHVNNVFNGIAYRQATDTFLVTGKNWNFLFEI